MTPGEPKVRDARVADLPAILEIHNRAITETTAIWDEQPVDLADRRAWFDNRIAHGRPILVAEIDGELAGYAGYGPWRPRTGYRHTVENSVYIADRFQRRGVGTALLAALLDRAHEAGDIHAVVAMIESSNTASIALHERFGFRTVGRLPEVGRKFGHWMDLTLMQYTLEMGVTS